MILIMYSRENVLLKYRCLHSVKMILMILAMSSCKNDIMYSRSTEVYTPINTNKLVQKLTFLYYFF